MLAGLMVMSCPNCNESWAYDGEGIISTTHLIELYADLDEMLLEHLHNNSRCWLVVGKMLDVMGWRAKDCGDVA